MALQRASSQSALSASYPRVTESVPPSSQSGIRFSSALSIKLLTNTNTKEGSVDRISLILLKVFSLVFVYSELFLDLLDRPLN